MSEPATPPSPAGLPVLGHGYAFSRDPFGALERWAEYGDVVTLRLPGQEAVQVTDPDLIGTVLGERRRFELSDAQREVFAGLEDDAVTTTRGERWKRLRTTLQSAVTREAVDRHADGMAAVAADHVARWANGDRLDLHREMRRLSLRMLTNTLLDVTVDSREDVLFEAADATVARADLRRPGQLLPDWIPTPTDRRLRRAVEDLDALVEEILAERRTAEDASSGDDVASVLLAAHERGDLSAAELRDNLVAMLLGGHDTVAVTFTYAWYLLSEHPAVRTALVDEYDAVVGDRRDGPSLPTAGDVASLTTARHVVAETLRLYPPAPITARQTTQPVTLGGYELPAGVQVLCPQWVCHRDERWWTEPETFDPSRWDRDADRPESAYFPFGGGPRHCLGINVARVELALGLATMAGRVSLSVDRDEPLSLVPSLTLRPEGEVSATVRVLDGRR